MNDFKKIKQVPFYMVALFCFFKMQNDAFSKDLFGRLGLGYNAEYSVESSIQAQSITIPAISLRYGILPRSVIDFILGASLGSSSASYSVTALKYMQTIHHESYANFYLLLSGATVSRPQKSGTEFRFGFGSEFYIPGVESVGISFETGFSAENHSHDSFLFKTYGISFINAGMHFYF